MNNCQSLVPQQKKQGCCSGNFLKEYTGVELAKKFPIFEEPKSLLLRIHKSLPLNLILSQMNSVITLTSHQFLTTQMFSVCDFRFVSSFAICSIWFHIFMLLMCTHGNNLWLLPKRSTFTGNSIWNQFSTIWSTNVVCHFVAHILKHYLLFAFREEWQLRFWWVLTLSVVPLIPNWSC
jgi:hypothetical protein